MREENRTNSRTWRDDLGRVERYLEMQLGFSENITSDTPERDRGVVCFRSSFGDTNIKYLGSRVTLYRREVRKKFDLFFGSSWAYSAIITSMNCSGSESTTSTPALASRGAYVDFEAIQQRICMKKDLKLFTLVTKAGSAMRRFEAAELFVEWPSDS